MNDRTPGLGAPDIDLLDFSVVVWRSRGLVLGCMLVVGGLFAAYALIATPWYRAEVVLVPVEEDASQGLLGRFGDLASLAGISAGESSRMQANVAVIRSRDLAREFIEQKSMEPELIEAAKGGFVSRALASLTRGKPSSRDALEFFARKVRVVEEDRKAGVLRLAMMWTERERAAQWANAYAAYADHRLRNAAQLEAEQNVEYLKGELAKTNVPALQQSLSRLLEAEMGKLLLTRGGADYAFKVVDRAIAPKEKTSPKRVLLVLVGSVIGLMLGMTVAFIRYLSGRVRGLRSA
jgi:uncharacterized protein involved in exopolysaccharide biosynthesis